MERPVRLLLIDRQRVLACDSKLNRKEEFLADRGEDPSRRVCKCNICLGETRSNKLQGVVREHLGDYGRDLFYRGSTEGFPSDDSNNEWNARIREEWGTRGVGFVRQAEVQLDAELDMNGLVEHIFHVYNILAGGGLGEANQDDVANAANAKAPASNPPSAKPEYVAGDAAPSTLEVYGNEGEEPNGAGEEDIPVEAPLSQAQQEYLEETAKTPLFAGGRLSSLSATLLLLNTLRTNGASNVLGNEVFQILARRILSGINSLPVSEYAALKQLKQLGVAYKTIHVCLGPNTCMLFCGTINGALKQCSKCGAERYKQVGKAEVPAKVLRWFRLTSKLQRMFSTPVLAKLMTWHARNLSTNNSVRHTANSYQWKWLNWHWPDLGKGDRNLQLGLLTDGMNPYSVKRSTWSTWLILITNYNVPPWLTKKHFIMLSLIIPGIFLLQAKILIFIFNRYLKSSCCFGTGEYQLWMQLHIWERFNSRFGLFCFGPATTSLGVHPLSTRMFLWTKPADFFPVHMSSCST